MEMMVIEDKIRKVQKLLAMAKNAGSEQEAASAAERAAELMQKHNLTEAELRIMDPKMAAEPIERAYYIDNTRKKVAWKSTIAYAVAQSYGCHQYFWGGSIVALGRRSSVEAMKYTCMYLFREVNQLAEAAYKRAGSYRGAKAWKGNFRLGASNEIARRLRLKTVAEKRAREEALEEAKELLRRNTAFGEGAVVEEKAAAKIVEAMTAASLPASTVALAVVAKDQDEVDEAYERESKGFRRKFTGFSRRVTLADAYQEGVAAGGRVRIGETKGNLKAPPGQIER